MLTFGDRIDLLLVLEGGSGSEGARQQLVPLVENVRVLATGQTPLATRDADLPAGEDDPDNMYSTVTVGVSAEQATQLLLAKDMGSVVVLLRNRSDEGPLQASTLSADGVLGGGRSDGYEYFSGSQSQGGTLQPSSRVVAGRTERRLPTAATPPAPDAAAGEPEAASAEPSTAN
jgi:pilus assembly protein CpaB